MSLPIFPQLPSMAWNNKKYHRWDVKVKKPAKGKRKTMTNQAYPEWVLEMSFTCLNQMEVEKMVGFIGMVKGQLSPFLWKDMEDYKQTNVRIGMGNGENTGYQIIRNWGDLFIEPVYDIVPGSLAVFVDGQLSSFTLEEDGWIILTEPPETGAIITASFEYYWRVAFEDLPDWQNFWYGFYSTNSFTVVSVT